MYMTAGFLSMLADVLRREDLARLDRHLVR